jgi:general stress protein YciG
LKTPHLLKVYEKHPTTTMRSKETNPGNFANRPREEVSEIARKGGQSSGGGFAGMDPDKQVCW